MDIAFEQKIRQRAYEIWMAAGMVEGAADEHWLLAKDDVLNETQMPAPAAAGATKRVAKAKTAEKSAKPAAKVAAKVATKPKAAAKTARKPAKAEAHASV